MESKKSDWARGTIKESTVLGGPSEDIATI